MICRTAERTLWEAGEIPMGFFLFRAQVRLQACCFSHFPLNHLLMQLAITPAILGDKKR